jgi:hypothetical protein
MNGSEGRILEPVSGCNKAAGKNMRMKAVFTFSTFSPHFNSFTVSVPASPFNFCFADLLGNTPDMGEKKRIFRSATKRGAEDPATECC